tara:strand:- start:275 stop:613 length:339 start_codon:yes stop_codon:yes gene_type:complete
MTTPYKYEEIKEHFNNYLDENLNYHKDNNPHWREDLHHYAFNEDYYIIGRYQAKQWLGDMAFDVINIIKDYEQDNFGQVTTDFSEPENVVNMYAYIVGEQIVHGWLDENANN